jgi:hypothetical protein
MKILKARSMAEIVISPNGEIMCASDSSGFFYVVSLKNLGLIHEEELDNDLESMVFDKSGQLLFLNDGIMVSVRLSSKDFNVLPLVGADEFEDPSGFKFMDSNSTGEVIFFLPVDSNIYKSSSVHEKFQILAHVPYDTVSGNFLGKNQDKLVLSAIGSSKVIVMNLEDLTISKNIPPIEKWSHEGRLEGISSDNENYAIFLENTMSIFDSNSSEICKFKLPSKDSSWLTHKLSPDFSLIALSGSGGVYLFDVSSGKELSFHKTNKLAPNELVFVPHSDNKMIVGSLSDGEVILMKFE